MHRNPPFASGRIAGSYEPLFLYWEEARARGRGDLVEDAMLREDDYRLLRGLVARYRRLGELLDVLTSLMEDRVDPDIAREAYVRYGVAGVRPVDARRLIARLLASWLIEAGEYWGILKVRI